MKNWEIANQKRVYIEIQLQWFGTAVICWVDGKQMGWDELGLFQGFQV